MTDVRQGCCLYQSDITGAKNAHVHARCLVWMSKGDETVV
ncbi:hypothetical protein AWT69_002278 [Pseudomonas putida]|nr:hypothetical protein AWT69_002278 [Pseudomonas putida]